MGKENNFATLFSQPDKKLDDLDKLKEKGFPTSLNEFVGKIREKIEWFDELRPKSSIVYIKDFIKDYNRFLSDIKEYHESVKFFERLRKDLEGDKDFSKEYYERNLELQNIRRKILHDSVIKNFVRLIISYREIPKTFLSLPEDKYLTSLEKEKLRQEKFPWACKVILDEGGEIQRKFISQKEGFDLDFLTEDERELFSSWALILSEDFQKAEEARKSKEILEDREENKKITELIVDMDFLDKKMKEVEEFEKLSKTKETNKNED